MVPIATAKDLKNSLGENADLVLLDNCGHSPFVDQLEKVLALIEGY